jgi:Domain of unknown function (DUF4190)
MTGPKNGLGNTALVVAIVGLFSCWSVLGGIACGVLAIILGFVGRGRASRGEADNGGIALAGIALGFLAIVASLVFAAIWASAWNATGGSDYLDCVMKAGQDRKAADACLHTWISGVDEKFGVKVTPGST